MPSNSVLKFKRRAVGSLERECNQQIKPVPLDLAN